MALVTVKESLEPDTSALITTLAKEREVVMMRERKQRGKGGW